MNIKTTRRTFIKQAAVAGTVGSLMLTSAARAASSRKLRLAAIGVGRRGAQDLEFFVTHPDLEVVALCDVDLGYLQEAAKKQPEARRYRDWRELLDKEQNRIDAITTATPNHMHAPISMTAMSMGKHVYCQKPLTHSLHEARRLAEESVRRPEIVTQMGVQTHSHTAYRTAVAMIQYGVIGKIKEAHSWDLIRHHYTGAIADPHLRRRPDRQDEVPETLDWNLWLGVAPERPYVKDLYHTRWWRCWHDFGGGAHGDMGGHMMDVVFAALELTSPRWVMSHRSPPYEETFSPDNKVQYRFPETRYTAGDIDYYWHDTGPVDEKSSWPVDQDKDLPANGSMLIGEKGYMLLPHVAMPQLLPEDDLKGAVEDFQRQVGEVKGSYEEHYHQFIDACLGKGKVTTPFTYSGRLTESVLMGAIVNRFPKEQLIWDAKALRFTNKPEANTYLSRVYRSGWEVPGLEPDRTRASQ